MPGVNYCQHRTLQDSNLDDSPNPRPCHKLLSPECKLDRPSLRIGHWVSLYGNTVHIMQNYALTVTGASGYIKFLVPHEKILRWIEGKLNLLGRLPHYVSVDQKTYGRYGVLPTTMNNLPRSPEPGQRLGP